MFNVIVSGSDGFIAKHLISKLSKRKKVKIIKKSLELASINGNLVLISKLNLNSLLEIKPSKNLAWFASYAIRSLLISDKIEEAIKWYEVLKKEKDKNTELLIKNNSLSV